MAVECYGGGGGGGVVPFCGVALVVVARSLPVNKTLSVLGKKKNKPVRVSRLEALSSGFLYSYCMAFGRVNMVVVVFWTVGGQNRWRWCKNERWWSKPGGGGEKGAAVVYAWWGW